MSVVLDSKPARIWYIHGNLQKPTVWSCFQKTWKYQDRVGQSHHFESIYENLWDTEAQSFSEWVSDFCTRVSSKTANSRQFLMGYSLGGRLALHTIIHQPELWTGAIIVGAHPGLASLEAKAQCLIRDQLWGERFLSEPWPNLLSEWDQLAVFGGYPNVLPRVEQEFNRAKICELFSIFSKGRQANLMPALSQLSHPPILFISGAEDLTYSALGQILEQHCSNITHAIIPQAAHRVPWENPQKFIHATQAFLNQQL